jgi:flagellar basal body-associated protein FliL
VTDHQRAQLIRTLFTVILLLLAALAGYFVFRGGSQEASAPAPETTAP